MAGMYGHHIKSTDSSAAFLAISGRIPVQHAVDEGAQCGGKVASAGVLQKQPRP
jgi:hypothetical protein